MRRRGLTVIELLVIVSVLGILLGLSVSNLLGFRRHLNLEDAVNLLSQDIQTCRTNALSWGDNCRLRFLGGQTYVMERKTSPTGYTPVLTRNLSSPVSISNVPAGAWLEFDPRTLLTYSSGFPVASLGTAAPEIRLTNGSKTFRLLVSMVGAVKTAVL